MLTLEKTEKYSLCQGLEKLSSQKVKNIPTVSTPVTVSFTNIHLPNPQKDSLMQLSFSN